MKQQIIMKGNWWEWNLVNATIAETKKWNFIHVSS